MLALGLDIGGANLKAATSDGDAVDRPFPLWKRPESLSSELRSIMAELPRVGVVAVTMTGELADCYPSKADGVRSIVDAVRAATDVPIRVWQTGGEFLEPGDAVELHRLVAAANWHALATFCGRVVPNGPAILVDIGSTTSDLIPLDDGCVCSEGLTDLERLRSGELVYTGASRTPLCAFGPVIRVDGRNVAIAAEFFATTRDVYLLLDQCKPGPDDLQTADGRPATVAWANVRISRMLCSDPEELSGGFAVALATAFAERQRQMIRCGIEAVLARLNAQPVILLSGSGSPIGEQVVRETPALSGSALISLESLFKKRVSRSACAFAVARLAAERVTLR